jgi:hypothetical protein
LGQAGAEKGVDDHAVAELDDVVERERPPG